MKTYTLEPMKQLIDLNGDITNFSLTFTATSKDGTEFDALVVDQTTLDNNNQLEYKKAKKGSISGNIVSNSDIYQNFYLILKSSTKCDCDVEIKIKEVPVKIAEKLEPPTKNNLLSEQFTLSNNSSTVNWKIAIPIIAICVILLVLFFYNKNKSPPPIISTENIKNVLTEELPLPTPAVNDSPQINLSMDMNTDLNLNQDLMDRLNNLKVT